MTIEEILCNIKDMTNYRSNQSLDKEDKKTLKETIKLIKKKYNV